MFVTDNDWDTLADEEGLAIISQSSETNKNRAVRMSIDEITAYLSSRYNCKKIFNATGEERNNVVLMYVMDCALYHMCSWLPQRMGIEIRKERYERVLEWLEKVNKGILNPSLPSNLEDDEGNINEDKLSVTWHSLPKNNNWW